VRSAPGLNGAGKSTTLKMLCGLTPITAGDAAVLGAPYRQHPNPGRRVGQYSLGMRQRLGIAHALLGDPEVLILDEPANGLDPDGMRWMRGLLRDFAARGGTVLLSSHLLHEIEAIADHLVIISGGRIVAQGTREDLLGGMSSTLVRAGDPSALRAALAAAGIDVSETADGGVLADAAPDRVGEAARRGGVALRELRADGDSSLEQLFFSLTATGGETDREPEEEAS